MYPCGLRLIMLAFSCRGSYAKADESRYEKTKNVTVHHERTQISLQPVV